MFRHNDKEIDKVREDKGNTKDNIRILNNIKQNKK